MTRQRAATTAQALEIELDGRRIPYQLRRSARRTLGVQVGRDGVRVAAPQRLPQRDIDAFLSERQGWLIARLDAWTQAAPTIVLRDGARFPLLDAPCRLQVVRGRGTPCWQDEPATLVLPCVAGQSVFAAAMRAIKARARAHFDARLAHFAAALGVVAPPLKLSTARTRWGSCSARSVRLNWRLILLPEALVDYVVAHEVAHLRHMDHSPAFWACVHALYPAAGAARADLRTRGRQLPELVAAAAGDALS
ncbi:MAG: M48 family metallopeptidase [Rhodocyclaceae bacterium]|nr:M48 family metallopeptidase [Rhodocyclaceae bacterium]